MAPCGRSVSLESPQAIFLEGRRVHARYERPRGTSRAPPARLARCGWAWPHRSRRCQAAVNRRTPKKAHPTENAQTDIPARLGGSAKGPHWQEYHSSSLFWAPTEKRNHTPSPLARCRLVRGADAKYAVVGWPPKKVILVRGSPGSRPTDAGRPLRVASVASPDAARPRLVSSAAGPACGGFRPGADRPRYCAAG